MKATKKASGEPLLKAYHAVFGYGRVPIIESVNLEIYPGDCIGLVGANGSGKSTLVRGLLGLLPPMTGQIVRAKDMSIGYLAQRNPQSDSLFPATVQEVVACGIHGHKRWDRKHPKHKHTGRSIASVMEMLKISHLAEHRIGELSGGQHQRVLLARALVMNPQLLVLDEPTSALDANMRSEFYALIQELKEEGVAILMISHDVSHLEHVIDKMLYLDRGIQFFGPTQEFYASDWLHRYEGGVGTACPAGSQSESAIVPSSASQAGGALLSQGDLHVGGTTLALSDARARENTSSLSAPQGGDA